MKYIKQIKLILFILIVFFSFNCKDIFAYEVNGKDYNFYHKSSYTDADIKEACIYTEDGYHNVEFAIVFIYNDNSAYKTRVTDTGFIETLELVANWQDVNDKVMKKTAFDAYLDKKGCLDHIFFSSEGVLHKNKTYLGDNNYYNSESSDDDDRDFSTVLEDLNKGLNNSAYAWKLVTEKDYMEEDLTTCEYRDFRIKYTKADGIVRNVEAKNNVPTAGIVWSYSISESYKDNYNLLEDGFCPVVYACRTATTTSGANYSLYVDDLVAEDDYKGCSADKAICTGGDYCDPTYKGICPEFSRLYREIEENYRLYQEKKDITALNVSKRSEDKLKKLCRQITKFTDYDSPCLENCNQLGVLLENIKETNDNNFQCGFSEKLIHWIANIVRWVKYIIPVAVIILGILDFIKAISGDKEDEMKKAQQRFIRRLIAAALIFIIPFIIEFILVKFGFDSNGCGIINL